MSGRLRWIDLIPYSVHGKAEFFDQHEFAKALKEGGPEAQQLADLLGERISQDLER
jgi:hypothetical protein